MPQADFQALIDAHYQGLHWFALSLCRHAADAADLTQQTFYRWATKGHQLRDPGAAKAWLFKTLYREFLRQRRRTSREEPLPPDDLLEPVEATTAVDRLDSATVLAALDRLPTDHRAVVTMFYLQQFTYQQIADVLDVPIGTVMSRLHRGKAALRKALADPALAPAAHSDTHADTGNDPPTTPRPRDTEAAATGTDGKAGQGPASSPDRSNVIPFPQSRSTRHHHG